MSRQAPRRPIQPFALALAASAAWAATATSCLSQVLTISPEGAVTRYDQPGVFTDTGVTPFSNPTPISKPVASGAPVAVATAISGAAQRYALSSDLIEAVAWQESRFRHVAVSGKGASGVMQLMPGTARDLGVDPKDLSGNVNGGTAYLTQLLNRYGGDIELTLAAYNAGPGAVDRYGGVPPYAETRAYVAAVLERMAYLATQPR